MISKNIYSQPIKNEDIIEITSDPQTHVGMDKYAIDFICNEGSQVLSAAKGEIVFLKVDSNEGGDDRKYENFKYYNHIVIKHNNAEYTEYGHLKHNGSTKKIGDVVERGEVIALSGNTGYSEIPHVHFSVFQLDNMKKDFKVLSKGKKYFINDEEFGFKTIEARFI